MKIKAIAPWFGSKRGMAPEIVRQLGPHRAFWEPFCGSMAVLLAKPECSQETANDLHGDLINLARVVRHPQAATFLYRRLRRTLVHEDLFWESAEWLAKAGPIEDYHIVDGEDHRGPAESCTERAYHFFVVSWLGRNGVIGTKQYNNNFCVRYTSNGGIQGTRFASAVDSIPAWRRRLREVTILRRDGFELLERIEDQDGTAIYCDPPYLAKGASYIHDFADAGHARLAEVLARFKKARVVVSYYLHERLKDLYPGWTLIDCTRAKSLSVQGQRGSKSKKAPEVLLINGPQQESSLFS